MIIEQTTQSKFFQSVTEYRKLPFLNYSSIKIFDESRNKFYRKCVLKEKFEEEDRSEAMILGDLVDCLQFTPDDFDKRFAMLSTGVSCVGQMKDFVENLWRITKECLDESGVITRDITSLLEEAFTSTAFDRNGERVAFKKKSLEQVIEVFESGPGLQYYKACRENLGKQVIDTKMRETAEALILELKINPVTAPILNLRTDGRYRVFKQLAISFRYNELTLKAMCDQVVVDVQEQEILIYDLKCTGWNIDRFETNILKNRYYLQWTLYRLAVGAWAKDNGYEDFDIIPMKFIVCCSDLSENPLIYTTSPMDFTAGMEGFELRGYKYKGLKQLLNEISWHQESGIWSMSLEDFQRSGIRPVKLFEK